MPCGRSQAALKAFRGLRHRAALATRPTEKTLLLVGSPVPRCASITRHPDRGDRDLPLVREIKGYRGMPDLGPGPGVPSGVYAQVLREETLRAGELLKLP